MYYIWRTEHLPASILLLIVILQPMNWMEQRANRLRRMIDILLIHIFSLLFRHAFLVTFST